MVIYKANKIIIHENVRKQRANIEFGQLRFGANTRGAFLIGCTKQNVSFSCFESTDK